MGVDPISEKFPHVSTYNYAENEPIGHIDLWGLQAVWSAAQASRSPERKKFQEENPNLSLAIAAVPVVIATGGLALEAYGLEAVTGFVANEVKDEALSQVTGGASDALDITKGATKIVQNAAKKVDDFINDAIPKAEAASLKGGNNTGDLTEMAKAFHSTLHPFKQKLTTTAVVEAFDDAGNIKNVVGHSDLYLPKAIKDNLGSNDIGVSGIFGHAEVSAIKGAKKKGLTPLRVGASRPICQGCQKFSKKNNVIPVEPLKD